MQERRRFLRKQDNRKNIMGICEEITGIMRSKKQDIEQYFKITEKEWDDRLEHIDNLKSVENIPEKDLTFIIACAYAINGTEGCNSLLKIVRGHELPKNYENESNQIWFEAMPLKGTSSPTLDMAFGNLKRPNDDTTKAQIEYINGQICFVEMKTWEDLQTSSTDNPKYNQLAKYIRAALIFQNAGIFPKEVHVTLVTPRFFKKNPKSRLYGYKFIEYACPEIHPENITNDIELPIENEKIEDDWIKCDKDGMNERLPFLKLHWVAYEDILDAVPQSPLKDYINRIRAANPIFEHMESK